MHRTADVFEAWVPGLGSSSAQPFGTLFARFMDFGFHRVGSQHIWLSDRGALFGLLIYSF